MKDLSNQLKSFADERDWNQFHSPKNLAMALSVEASEIVEHFQWMSEKESYSLPPDKLELVKEEIGDVLLYLVRLSDQLNIDPLVVAKEKLEKNKIKYPAEKVKGKSNKYSDY